MSYDEVELRRLGQPAEVGAVMGGWREVLSPADGLWADLKRLAAQDPAGYTNRAGSPQKRTRYEQGELQGRIQATATALAMVLRGHDFLYGDAGEQLVRQAQAEVRAEQEAARA